MLTLSKTEVLELLALFPALFFYNEQKDQVIHSRILPLRKALNER